MSVTLQAKSLGKSSCRSLLVDCAHGALANEAEVLRVVGRQLAAGRVEDTGHHIPVPLEALAIDVSELCTGFLIPVYRSSGITACSTIPKSALTSMARRYQTLQWRNYITKQQALAQMCNDIAGDSKPEHNVGAFGNASFAHNSRGDHQLLPKGLKKQLQGRFKLFEVDEYNTSALCCACNHGMAGMGLGSGRKWLLQELGSCMYGLSQCACSLQCSTCATNSVSCIASHVNSSHHTSVVLIGHPKVCMSTHSH